LDSGGGAEQSGLRRRPKRRLSCNPALAAAAGRCGVQSRALGDGQPGELLGGRGMNAHGVDQRVDGQAGLQGGRESLDHLTGHWPKVMQSIDTLVAMALGHRLQVAVAHALLTIVSEGGFG